MKNNKVIIYIGLIAVGMLFGWFLFSGSSITKPEHNHEAVIETNQLWTCSMHPQIMQPEPGDCPICGMDLIPAATSDTDGLMVDQFKLTENAMALADIQTSIVGNGRVENNVIKLSGKIVENEDNSAIQSAHFNGRIEKLFVNYLGEKVTKGQAIAQVYSADLVAAQQELITTYNIRETQPQLYKAVRNKFDNWKIHGSQLDEVLKTGKVKTSFTIYSHVSGVVIDLPVSVGAHIMDGKPIFKVSNLSTVWANFDVYEKQIELFKTGQKISITSNANSNKTFEAKVDFINPILDSKTRTVKLRAVLNNRDNLFKPGMFVEGSIEGKSTSKAKTLVIPASAVLWTGERSVVYLKASQNEPVFEMREIVLGTKIGDTYQVLEGLFDGDEIVTNGTFTVDAAAQLQGKKSMMNKNGGKPTTGHEGHLGMDESTSKSNEPPFNVNARLNVSADFQNQLKKVFDDYIQLKDDLVKDKSNKVEADAKTLLDHLNQIDMKLLKDKKAHNHWMTLEKEIKASANSIAKTSNLKEQRSHFKHLSSHLANAIQSFGINETVYYQFCPMADNDNGAYWLSQEQHVLNPYFGASMLKCGDIKQVIN